MQNPANKKSLGSIAIIGGGPAACATAQSILQEAKRRDATMSVTLFCDPIQRTWKVGETLNPTGLHHLKTLNMMHVIDEGHHIPCPGNISLWNASKPGHQDFLFSPTHHGYHLDRNQFDHQLLSALQSAGIDLRTDHHFFSVEQDEDQFHLQFSHPSEGIKHWTGNFVIDASGKASHFARKLGTARNQLDDVIFLCTKFSLPSDHNVPSHSLVEAVENGWWYGALAPNNELVVTFCSDQNCLREKPCKDIDWFMAQLAETEWLHTVLPMDDLIGKSPISDLATRSAPSAILSQVYGERWLAVGDAASSFDPITSAGIAKALHQGLLSGKAVVAYLIEKDLTKLLDYQTQVFEEFSRYINLRTELYYSEARFRHRPFWQRRVGL